MTSCAKKIQRAHHRQSNRVADSFDHPSTIEYFQSGQYIEDTGHPDPTEEDTYYYNINLDEEEVQREAYFESEYQDQFLYACSAPEDITMDPGNSWIDVAYEEYLYEKQYYDAEVYGDHSTSSSDEELDSSSPTTTARTPSPALQSRFNTPVCTLCYYNIADTLLLPCRHLSVCGSCCDDLVVRGGSKQGAREAYCPSCGDVVEDKITVCYKS